MQNIYVAHCREKYGVNLGSIAEVKPTKKSSTGVRGVYLKKQNNKFYYDARVKLKGKEILLGVFKTLDEAKKAREEGVKKYYHPIIKRAIKNGDFPC